MSNPCRTTQHKQQPTATCLPNTEQNRAKPSKPTDVKAVESKQTLGLLYSTDSQPLNIRNSQLRDFSVQDIRENQNSNWPIPDKSTISPKCSRPSSASVQGTIKNQSLTFRDALAESEVDTKYYQSNSASAQDKKRSFRDVLAKPAVDPKYSQSNSASAQDKKRSFRDVLAKPAVDPKYSQSNSASAQDKKRSFRDVLAKPAVDPKYSQYSSDPVQGTIGNQNLNFRSALAKPAAIPKCSKPSSASIQDTTKEQSSKSWPNHSTAKFTRPSTKTPQRNSYTDEAVTDEAVNTLITDVNNLYYSDQKDINRLITHVFNNFKRGASYLTDDHKKQLLSIIPTISEIIDTRNLDSISITNLLHSLTKTNACRNLNPSNIPIDKCIQYEQACKNLIDQILTKIQTYKKYQVRSWSITLYTLGELVEASPNVITSEQINNLMANLNIQKQSLTEFNSQEISNIFVAIVKLLKFNKLNSSSSSIATHSFLTYLLQQIKPAIGDCTAQNIANILLSIDKLANFPDFIQLISDKQDIIELLLEEAITNENLNWKPIDVSQVIYTLGRITDDIYLNKKVANIVKVAYHTLYSKVPCMVPKIDILSASFLLSGINKLIRNNAITSNKPSKSLIRGVFLEKIIADTSIINNNLYQNLNVMAHFQAYLTKNELIKILENINFFIPDINDAKSYFIAMGYLLAKIRKEIDTDKKNRKLIVLEHLIETEIKKAWLHFKPNIDSFNMSLITTIHNTCSLIYKAEDLTLLKATYKDIQGSNLEESSLAIIKTLILDPENLKIEYRINNNLPPVDACIIQPDGSMLAIEIQGTGHYLDDEGEYPTGKHLLKSARLQIENIQVIEVNGSKIMNYHNPKELAPPLINILLENNVKIRPEYCNNIPKLLRDAGFTSK